MNIIDFDVDTLGDARKIFEPHLKKFCEDPKDFLYMAFNTEKPTGPQHIPAESDTTRYLKAYQDMSEIIVEHWDGAKWNEIERRKIS